MLIKILKPETLLIEGCIRMAFVVGREVDLCDADAQEAIRLGIAEPVSATPAEPTATAPQEKAVTEPKEKKT